MTIKSHISRRSAITSGGVTGLGLITAVNAGASVEEQKLEMTDPNVALNAQARLVGNVGANKKRTDWFDGTLTGIAPDGHTVLFLKLQGTVETSLTPLEDRDGWQRHRKAEGIFLELETHTLLEHFLNPFSGETVGVPKFHYETNDVITGKHLPTWWFGHDQVIMDESEDFSYLGKGGTATTSRVALLKDIHDPSVTAVPNMGTWVAVGGWPDWLGMDQTFGHCLIRCAYDGGRDDVAFQPV